MLQQEIVIQVVQRLEGKVGDFNRRYNNSTGQRPCEIVRQSPASPERRREVTAATQQTRELRKTGRHLHLQLQPVRSLHLLLPPSPHTPLVKCRRNTSNMAMFRNNFPWRKLNVPGTVWKPLAHYLCDMNPKVKRWYVAYCVHTGKLLRVNCVT